MLLVIKLNLTTLDKLYRPESGQLTNGFLNQNLKLR